MRLAQLAPESEAVAEVIKAQAVGADKPVLSLDQLAHEAVEILLPLPGVADEVKTRERGWGRSRDVGGGGTGGRLGRPGGSGHRHIFGRAGGLGFGVLASSFVGGHGPDTGRAADGLVGLLFAVLRSRSESVREETRRTGRPEGERGSGRIFGNGWSSCSRCYLQETEGQRSPALQGHGNGPKETRP